MGEKMQYRTKQYDALLAYLKENSGKHISVNEICAHFRNENKPIGIATIYRLLEKMIGQGVVAKYIIDANSPAFFEYIDADSRHRSEGCFHCKCEICGRIVHMQCDEVAALKQHIKGHHGFAIDPLRTVFYGVCDSCTSKNRV